MYIHQKNTNYAEAEKSRLKIEQLKKDLEARTIYEMEHRHQREMNDLNKANNEELAEFNNLMNKRGAEITQEGEKSEQELLAKHKQELDQARKNLENELSRKTKESSELLNLREMERHMVNQKK